METKHEWTGSPALGSLHRVRAGHRRRNGDIATSRVAMLIVAVMVSVVSALAMTAGPASAASDFAGSGDRWASDAYQAAATGDLGSAGSGDLWASDRVRTAEAAANHAAMWADAQRDATAATPDQAANAPVIPELAMPDDGTSTLLYVLIAGGVALLVAIVVFGTRAFLQDERLHIG